jgi:hypothetical protein
MLGKKTPGSLESLSQGTFVHFLLPLITANWDDDRSLQKAGKDPGVYPDRIFNDYYRANDDATILRVLLNVFDAAKSTWPLEWETPSEYILTKSNGFTGIMKALPTLVKQGKANGDLSREYFSRIFNSVKAAMAASGISFTLAHFEPSSVGENKFRDLILRGMDATSAPSEGAAS